MDAKQKQDKIGRKYTKKGPPPKKEGVEHNGFWFAVNHDGYYRSKNGGGMLHRVIWEEHFGAIPKGFSIHHLDGNRRNNDIANLAMVSKSAHATHHNTGREVTEETRIKMSISTTIRYKLLPEETKERIKRYKR